jgi:hypothetical protein
MAPAYHPEAVTADTAAHGLDAVSFIQSKPRSKRLLPVREGHRENIGKREADFEISIL